MHWNFVYSIGSHRKSFFQSFVDQSKSLNPHEFVEGVFECDDLLEVGVALRQLDEEEQSVVAKNLATVDLFSWKRKMWPSWIFDVQKLIFESL